MVSCLSLVNTDTFFNAVPGNAPSEEDYKKFKKPDLDSKKQDELYAEVAMVVQSVLDAAECDALCFKFLDTASHKTKDCNTEKKDVFNTGGLYTNSPVVHASTKCVSDGNQMMPGQSRVRSWDWIDIPFQMTMSEQAGAFHSGTKSRGDETIPAVVSSAAYLTTGTHIPSGNGLEDSVAHVVHGGEGGVGSVTHDTLSVPDAAVADHLPLGSQGAKKTTEPVATISQAPPSVGLSEDGEKALVQYIEYVLDLQRYQHRTFSYAIYIDYDMALLVYLDCSGASISQPFQWVETDSLLHRFIWKVAKLANAGRSKDLGHDPTATLASVEARNKFMALKDDRSLPPHVRNGFKKATADKWPIYKLEVASGEPSKDEWFNDMTFPPPKEFSDPSMSSPSQSTPLVQHSSSLDALSSSCDIFPSVRQILVGRPHFTTNELIGRCMKGYFAYDVTDPDEKNWCACFLKDSWRPMVPGLTRPEHLVYQRLRFFGVDKGLGTLICGGDVGGHWAQRTRAQDYLPEKNRPDLRVHYRLVIKEIGIPLEDFHSFPELSAIFVDVIQAHCGAWKRAQVLHGDISVGNIMILPPVGKSRRKGILIDWELSRLECELGSGRVKPNRIGTWRFRSALSLRYPWKPYRRSDDIESFIHVYTYLILQFHPIGLFPFDAFVRNLFDDVSLDRGVKYGGERKLAMFRWSARFEPYSNPRLQILLRDIIKKCSESYRMIDFAEMEQRYGFEHFCSPKTSRRRRSDVPDHSSATLVDLDSDFDSDSDSDNDIKQVLELPELDPPSVKTAPSEESDKDPCVVEGFLSEVGDLLDLFKEHSRTRLLHSDKACDQFLARHNKDTFLGPFEDPSQRASSDTSGSVSSRSAVSSLGSNSGYGPSTSLGKSSDVTGGIKEASECAVEVPSDSTRHKLSPPLPVPSASKSESTAGSACPPASCGSDSSVFRDVASTFPDVCIPATNAPPGCAAPSTTSRVLKRKATDEKRVEDVIGDGNFHGDRERPLLSESDPKRRKTEQS